MNTGPIRSCSSSTHAKLAAALTGPVAFLLTGPEGHVLIDGALPESVPQIVANIRTLGFRIEDVKLIVNSHAHYDHAGGIAAIQRATGARIAEQWAICASGEPGRIGIAVLFAGSLWPAVLKRRAIDIVAPDLRSLLREAR